MKDGVMPTVSIGIDPGKVALITYSSKSGNVSGQMTSREFYNQTKGKKASQRAIHWGNISGVNELDNVRAQTSSKVPTRGQYDQFLLTEHDHGVRDGSLKYGECGIYEQCSNQRMLPKYAGNRGSVFRRKIRFYSRKMFDIAKQCRGITLPPTNNALGMKVIPLIQVYYGGAHLRSTMRGLQCGGTPTRELRRVMNNAFDCDVVNECWTSQICFVCRNRLYKCMNGTFRVNGHRREVRGVRYCRECFLRGGGDAKRKFVSRDLNAAKNIVEKGEYTKAHGDGANHPDYTATGQQREYEINFYPDTNAQKRDSDNAGN